MIFLTSFLRFTAGGLIKLAPILIGVLSSLFGSLSRNQSLKRFLLKYGYWILIAFAGLYVIYKKEEKLLISELDNDPYKKAMLLSRYFGTTKGLSWWQPATWTEYEHGAYQLIMDNLDQIKQIESNYSKVTDNRNLMDDINKYLHSYQVTEFINATS